MGNLIEAPDPRQLDQEDSDKNLQLPTDPLLQLTARYLGEEAAKGNVINTPIEQAAKAAEQTSPDSFYAGAATAHWSNSDGSTGGLPPEKS